MDTGLWPDATEKRLVGENMDNQKRGRVIKKSRTKKVYAIVIIVCIALVAAALLLNRPTPTPSFKFLASRKPLIRVKHTAEKSLSPTIHLTYSFEADFNDVHAKARSELLALGYLEASLPQDSPDARAYRLSDQRGYTNIDILDKHRYKMYSTPRNSEYPSPDRVEPHYADGWISVTITQSRHPGRLKIMWMRLKYEIRSWFS